MKVTIAITDGSSGEVVTATTEVPAEAAARGIDIRPVLDGLLADLRRRGLEASYTLEEEDA